MILTKLGLIYVQKSTTFVNTCDFSVNLIPALVDNDPLSASSVTEDIDEELDEFLNGSISASEDFTKEETVTDESTSLKADYVEKL